MGSSASSAAASSSSVSASPAQSAAPIITHPPAGPGFTCTEHVGTPLTHLCATTGWFVCAKCIKGVKHWGCADKRFADAVPELAAKIRGYQSAWAAQLGQTQASVSDFRKRVDTLPDRTANSCTRAQASVASLCDIISRTAGAVTHDRVKEAAAREKGIDAEIEACNVVADTLLTCASLGAAALARDDALSLSLALEALAANAPLATRALAREPFTRCDFVAEASALEGVFASSTRLRESRNTSANYTASGPGLLRFARGDGAAVQQNRIRVTSGEGTLFLGDEADAEVELCDPDTGSRIVSSSSATFVSAHHIDVTYSVPSSLSFPVVRVWVRMAGAPVGSESFDVCALPRPVAAVGLPVTFTAYPDALSSAGLAISRDGRILAVSHDDQYVVAFYDLASGALLTGTSFGTSEFDSLGKMVTTAANTVLVVDRGHKDVPELGFDGVILRRLGTGILQERILELAACDDLVAVACAVGGSNDVTLLSFASGSLLRTISNADGGGFGWGYCRALCFGRDGASLYYGGNTRVGDAIREQVTHHDIEGTYIATVFQAPLGLRDIALDGEGNLLVAQQPDTVECVYPGGGLGERLTVAGPVKALCCANGKLYALPQKSGSVNVLVEGVEAK